MTALCLRFCDDSRPDLPLDTGVHALARQGAGLAPVASDGPWLLQLCHDRRGIWMTVAPGARGIHVNGRPVRQLAMLRPGDSIHVDGQELLLVGAPRQPPLPPSPSPSPGEGSLRLVLRGIGGDHHGRSLSLEKPRRIGSSARADLRIEGHGIAPEHAVLALVDGQPLLHQTAAEVLVNGVPMRQAVLQAGDQLVFGGRHRFVLEGPPPSVTAAAGPRPPPPRSGAPRPPRGGPGAPRPAHRGPGRSSSRRTPALDTPRAVAAGSGPAAGRRAVGPAGVRTALSRGGPLHCLQPPAGARSPSAHPLTPA